jgi:hypothetical protein
LSQPRPTDLLRIDGFAELSERNEIDQVASCRSTGNPLNPSIRRVLFQPMKRMWAYPKTNVGLDRVRPRPGQREVLPDHDLIRVRLLDVSFESEVTTFNGRHFPSGFSLLSPLCGGHSKPAVVDVRVA